MEIDEASSCYCGKPRCPEKVELQCGLCLHWFHERCISCYLGSCLPFMTSYAFVCKMCNPGGMESFMKKQASFTQICQTTVANLILLHPDQLVFSKDKDIIPFIEKHWDSLTAMPRRTKAAWHNTVMKTMAKESDIFLHVEETAADPCFTLRHKNMFEIKPNYKDFGLVDMQVQPTPSRMSKRKAPASDNQSLVTVGKPKNKDPLSSSKFIPTGLPNEHPFNKDGYRYILVESDPHAPDRQAFEESMESSLNKPMTVPAQFYRVFVNTRVGLALQDRAPQLKVGEDRLTVTGDKGYSMVRATHGVNKGSWYFEVTITEMPADSSTRIGWVQQLGNLQAPLGYDKFGYSWRSLKGTKFHNSRGKHYAATGYKEGDVVGFYLQLPQPKDLDKLLPPAYKDKPLITFKSHLYFEAKDQTSEAVNSFVPAPGSKIVFYKNGVSQGEAFTDIYCGWYYPGISLYKNATVCANFGPTFKYPPTDVLFNPMCDAVQSCTIEHTLADMLFHVEHQGKLAKSC